MLLHSTYFNLGPNNTVDVANAYMSEALEYLSTSQGDDLLLDRPAGHRYEPAGE